MKPCATTGLPAIPSVELDERGDLMAYDLIIKNGTVIDGTGSFRRRADVAVKDGIVAEIGRITDAAAVLLNRKARGCEKSNHREKKSGFAICFRFAGGNRKNQSRDCQV